MNTVCNDIYNSRSLFYKNPFGAVKCGTEVKFTVKFERKSPAQNVKLSITDEVGTEVFAEMDWQDLYDGFDVFSCKYTFENHGLYLYCFEFERDNKKLYVNAAHGKGEESDKKGDAFQLTVYKADYKTPDWFKGGVMYQILPDRFCKDGDFPPDETGKRIYLKDWGNGPVQTEEGGYRSHDFFGGNLKGIIKKLPYLKSLGVTAVYLNPIFFADAYHRYNTSDYMRIDPLLGTEEDFKGLCCKAKELNIGIILDGVFSHTGTDSIYFNKENRYKEPGAYTSKNSRYYGWYDFKNWPDKYRCWWGIEDLPQINTDNKDFIEYVTGKNGVLEKWLNDGASGFRLDVADELTPEFIEALRKSVKRNKKDAVIIGEVWEDASNKISYGTRRKYLDGEQLDSVMNYPWRNAVINYIKTGNCETLKESVMTILENYPKETVDCLYNLLGTHDTVRIITCLSGENSADKSLEWKQNTHIPQNKRIGALNLVKLAAAVIYLLPGVPCIYYGDEAGFEGYEDPFNRRCYMWGEEDKPLIEWYKTLGKLRNLCPALKCGSYREIISDNGLFAFERKSGNETVTLAINMGGSERTLDAEGKEWLNFSGSKIENSKAVLPPKTLLIYGKGSWIESK